jgi:hypothetical protein
MPSKDGSAVWSALNSQRPMIELTMKRITLSIPGYPDCHVDFIFTRQALEAITAGAPFHIENQKTYSIKYGEA